MVSLERAYPTFGLVFVVVKEDTELLKVGLENEGLRIKVSSEYIAGLVDGEGSIRIAKFPTGTYQLVVAVEMMHHDTIFAVANFADHRGSLGIAHHMSRLQNVSMRFECRGSDASWLLRQIQPFAITKRKQIELAIEFQESRVRRTGRKTPQIVLDLHGEMYEKMRALNKEIN